MISHVLQLMRTGMGLDMLASEPLRVVFTTSRCGLATSIPRWACRSIRASQELAAHLPDRADNRRSIGHRAGTAIRSSDGFSHLQPDGHARPGFAGRSPPPPDASASYSPVDMPAPSPPPAAIGSRRST